MRKSQPGGKSAEKSSSSFKVQSLKAEQSLACLRNSKEAGSCSRLEESIYVEVRLVDQTRPPTWYLWQGIWISF